MKQDLVLVKQQISDAKSLSQLARHGGYFNLSYADQELCEDYDYGRLDRKLTHLLELQSSMYKGTGGTVRNW